MRERVEDLGRLSVLLDNILEKEIFSSINCRPKDFAEVFYGKDRETQEDLLRTFAYGISDVESEICECRVIALGQDDLNEPTE